MQSVDPYMSQCVPNLLQLGLVGHITRVLLFCIVFLVDRALGIVCVCTQSICGSTCACREISVMTNRLHSANTLKKTLLL